LTCLKLNQTEKYVQEMCNLIDCRRFFASEIVVSGLLVALSRREDSPAGPPARNEKVWM